jgi:hypothetical protein
VRQAETKPLMEDFKLWLDARLGEVSQKSSAATIGTIAAVASKRDVSIWQSYKRFSDTFTRFLLPLL